MKSVWKTSKRFEIDTVGQNLFLVFSDNEMDMEHILEAGPWFFRRQLVLMDKLLSPFERERVELAISPLWLKMGPCAPKYDKKDLMHVVGSTFGGLQRSEVLGNFCRIRVLLNIRKPLRRGIFVSTTDSGKTWLAFKYENLPIFYFGCGRMGHGVMDCGELTQEHKMRGKIRSPIV